MSGSSKLGWVSKKLSSRGSGDAANGNGGNGGGGAKPNPINLGATPDDVGISVVVSSPGSPSGGSPLARSQTVPVDSGSPQSPPPTPKRWSSSGPGLLTPSSAASATKTFAEQQQQQQLDNAASQLILNALERTQSNQGSVLTSPATSPRSVDMGRSFSKLSLSSMMSSLSLSRTSTRENPSTDESNEKRGRSLGIGRIKSPRAASHAPEQEDERSRSRSRARSTSPFSFRRFRNRDRDVSPTPQPVHLSVSDVDLPDQLSGIRPRTAFSADDEDSGEETVGEYDTDEVGDEEWSEDELDPLTEQNTNLNAVVTPVPMDHADAEAEPDPLGEGVNMVIPQAPYFPSTLMSAGPSGVGGRKKRKSTRLHDPLPLDTSRPKFERDRCTITLRQGDPGAHLEGRRGKKYVVASDMSEESRYAVEWGIGTVLRDGDSMLIVTIVENESKVDPSIPNPNDKTQKVRSQQERQGLAYIIVRQATGLLQRTKLHVTVECQAWHAKNLRHMLLDIVDYYDPVMLIVGSRGLGQLKGILLGSTSHYLIQKCSVPVMVARRRLKRPPKRSAHLMKNRRHVSLAEASIDKVATKVDEDVQAMRDQIQRDDDRRDGKGKGKGRSSSIGIVDEPEAIGEGEGEVDEDTIAVGVESPEAYEEEFGGVGVKVAGG